ncbi:hypothetical protein IW261DRAFT_1576962 [Armillaria novae-zelandiae]|uniref:Uncharacterized protein n=1 Tax=Armillaria novae-zelandiae TaxID=153914 RepID=A0AA39N9I6_9AGAR|nr:hypothetical protein IW261DRAFT_1576962 [Armillaria novae-zelandiae]
MTNRLLRPNETSDELGGDEELDPKLFWQDASFGRNYFSMCATERDRFAYDNLLGHAVPDDQEDDSFPLPLRAMFEDDDGATEAHGQVDERYDHPQPEPSGSDWPLLPSLDSDHFDDVQGKVMPVQTVNDILQKRHHSVVDGDEARQGGEESTIGGDVGDKDNGRRMSKRAQKPPASHALIAVGWLPSAVQYLTDRNLGSEWLDLLAAWQVLEGLISESGVTDKGSTGCHHIKAFVAVDMASKPTLQRLSSSSSILLVRISRLVEHVAARVATIRNRSPACS